MDVPYSPTIDTPVVYVEADDDTMRPGMLSGNISISSSFEELEGRRNVLSSLFFFFFFFLPSPTCPAVGSSSSRLPRCYCHFRREWPSSSDELQLKNRRPLQPKKNPLMKRRKRSGERFDFEIFSLRFFFECFVSART